MSYIKTSWVARVGTALNRFLKTNESAGSVELTNDPTGVTTAGTPFTVANMNKIEQGIYDAHVTADANASNLLANVNQGVKTTDSPKFSGIGVTSYLHGEYTEDDVFTFLSPFIPTTGDAIIITGSYKNEGTGVCSTSRAYRSSANTVIIYVMNGNSVFLSSECVEGDTSVVTLSIAL